ncbi:hypothetical protein MUK42_36647 [Musa troglodytarum]|uniref:Uncharacterized protein n=1 Tax=Musa troglodytarum TaxID=320322 RepID=A0A9E7KY41_9LILI|nr:hypothetical protein MUK42_36647 [Musa troglodytarum]
MGNCVASQKRVSGVDEDDFWGALGQKSSGCRGTQQDEAKLLLESEGEERGAGSTEIKIRINKKQLEELLRGTRGEERPLRQLLADLMSMGETGEHHDQETHWRPSLQTIPEVPE